MFKLPFFVDILEKQDKKRYNREDEEIKGEGNVEYR